MHEQDPLFRHLFALAVLLVILFRRSKLEFSAEQTAGVSRGFSIRYTHLYPLTPGLADQKGSSSSGSRKRPFRCTINPPRSGTPHIVLSGMRVLLYAAGRKWASHRVVCREIQRKGRVFGGCVRDVWVGVSFHPVLLVRCGSDGRFVDIVKLRLVILSGL